jgi:hypothetical protein
MTRPNILPVGPHLAPFLSPSGKAVLLAMDIGGRLLAMAEVAELRGTHRQPDIGLPGGPGTIDDAASFYGALKEWRGRFLRRGVHIAPWRSGLRREVLTLLAIDALGRLVARMDAPRPRDVPAVERNLHAVLEAVEASLIATAA